jgi:hypothetical protein
METDQPLGTEIAAFASTSTFQNVGSVVKASTQFPDASTSAVLFADPSTFTGTPSPLTGTQMPCTPILNKKGQYVCPPLLGGDAHGQD